MNSAEIAFPNIGIYIPHLPKGITIGGFTIAFYGMIIAAGMLSGLWLACHQAQRTGQKKEVYTRSEEHTSDSSHNRESRMPSSA